MAVWKPGMGLSYALATTCHALTPINPTLCGCHTPCNDLPRKTPVTPTPRVHGPVPCRTQGMAVAPPQGRQRPGACKRTTCAQALHNLISPARSLRRPNLRAWSQARVRAHALAHRALHGSLRRSPLPQLRAADAQTLAGGWRRAARLLSRRPLELVHGAVEANAVGDVRARNLPRVAVGQPDVRQLVLVPVFQRLPAPRARSGSAGPNPERIIHVH